MWGILVWYSGFGTSKTDSQIFFQENGASLQRISKRNPGMEALAEYCRKSYFGWLGGILEPTGGYLIPPLDHRAQQAGSVIEGRRRIQEKTGDGSLIPHLPVDPCRTREECLTWLPKLSASTAALNWQRGQVSLMSKRGKWIGPGGKQVWVWEQKAN